MNALKDGLRAETVVLPTESASAFQEHLDAWMADWQPPTKARAQLVEDAAVAAWRKKRCVRVESARLSKRMHAALARWDGGEARAIDEIVSRLDDEPADVLDALLRSRAGVDRLIAMWAAIGEAAASPDGWDDLKEHHVRLINLHGWCPGDDEASALKEMSWRLYLRNDEEIASYDDEPDPYDDDLAELVCAQIRATASARVARYRADRESLPDRSADRSRFAELEAFAPQPEDAALLRAEAQHTRAFHRSLGDLIKLTRSGDDLVAEVEAEAPNEPNAAEPVAAEGPPEPEAPNEPIADRAGSTPEASEGDVLPNEPNAGRALAVVEGSEDGPQGPIRASGGRR